MVPQVVTIGPVAAANAALIASSQIPISGTPLTRTGTQPDVARRILLSYGIEGSNRTLLVTGTNHTGNPISEILNVPSGAGAGTIATQQDFLTVTSLLPGGGGWTAAATVGTSANASTPWKTLEIFQAGNTMLNAVVLSGALNFSIQYTLDDPNNIRGDANVPPVPFAVPGLTGLTANADGQISTGAYAWRVLVNSGTTGIVRTTVIQTCTRD
jgi:hypothetical protein